MVFRLLCALGMFTLLVAVACADRQDTDREVMQNVDEAMEKIRPYSHDAARDPSRRHLALSFRVSGDSLILVPDSVFIRPGNMPYMAKNAGDFQVKFRDAEGREIGGYVVEDPRNLRSCDTSQGEPAGVSRATFGRIEIFLPADTAIEVIELTAASGKPQAYEVGRAIRAAKPQQEKPDE